MPTPLEHDLPSLDELDDLDRDRAGDMLDNRPFYGIAVPPVPPPPSQEREHP